MEIETLKYRVVPAERAQDFVDADETVWGPWLYQQRGFLRKTTTVYPGGVVHLRLYWATKKDLDRAAKSPEIPSLDVRLRAAFLGVAQRLP